MEKRYCIVPQCFNSANKTPDKLFFYVPLNPELRKKWLTATNSSIGPKTKAHCCEDHFDVENDMENYIKFKLVGGQRKLKKGVVPHKFACRKQSVQKPERSAVKKLKIAKLTTSSSECIASTSHDVEEIYIEDSIPRVQVSVNDPLKDVTRDENIEDDMDNYIKYKLVGGLLKLKRGVLPHKLISQNQEENNEKPETEIPTDVLEVETQSDQLCCVCLKSGDEIALKEFNIQCEPLKEILKVDSIILCYVCKEIARKAEYFIQNVRNSQILLQNYEGDIPEIKQCLPPTTLTRATLPSVELPGDGEEESCTVIGGEVKVEPMEDAHDYEEIFIKEEDTSHYLQSKEEVTEEDSCNQTTSETERKGERKVMNVIIPRRRKIKAMSASKGSCEAKYTIERISEKQCMKEREQRSQDSNYLSYNYKCVDCIKGFVNKASFNIHMKLHSLSRGDFSCVICKQRFESSRQMMQHKKCHTIRYKCTKCDLNRVSHSCITRHYAAKHTSLGACLHRCSMCPKVFKNRVSLRNHVTTTHSEPKRVACDACHLTFISTATLQTHILKKHHPDGVIYNPRKRHVCQHCGMGFQVLYQLKNHVAMHTENRPYYCVECDRSFKTELLLTRHLKTASRHVFSADLRFSCDQCEKRFNCRRDLERHVNGVHLNLRPHTCDQCDRAYLNSWSLREHKMYSHEGYRKDLRYPCTLCDKVFHRSSILKSHIRTHTGERPYRCKQCPAKFVQSSQLRTHTNLVHLKLTRNGKPKSTALK